MPICIHANHYANAPIAEIQCYIQMQSSSTAHPNRIDTGTKSLHSLTPTTPHPPKHTSRAAYVDGQITLILLGFALAVFPPMEEAFVFLLRLAHWASVFDRLLIGSRARHHQIHDSGP
jgi:hypothetical protein